ncbi:MAG: hypothetical protein KC636_22605, partial [Myxococcales bacterium]|nr:hypothetical protein [Myxococcales bacterium]
LAINIEIKPSSPTWSQRGDGSIVGEVIREAGAEDSVIVTSFDFFKLNALEKTHAALHSGFTYDDGMFRSLLDWLMFFPELRSQVTAVEGNQNPEALLNLVMESNAVGRWIGSTVIGVEHTLLDDDSVSRLRARGSQAVGTYTLLPLDVRTVRQIARANSPAEVERLVALGVDWIETDDPERLLELVAR